MVYISAFSLDEEYILQWNDHKYNFFSLAADDVFRSEEMTDITVCCEDQMFDAHKLILSVCSPLFRSMISRCVSRLNNQHPIIFLKVNCLSCNIHNKTQSHSNGVESGLKSANHMWEETGTIQMIKWFRYYRTCDPATSSVWCISCTTARCESPTETSSLWSWRPSPWESRAFQLHQHNSTTNTTTINSQHSNRICSLHQL